MNTVVFLEVSSESPRDERDFSRFGRSCGGSRDVNLPSVGGWSWRSGALRNFQC